MIPKELTTNYFFNNLKKLKYNVLLSDVTHPWEILNNLRITVETYIKPNVNPYYNAMTTDNIVRIGEFCNFESSVEIGKGTKLHSHVSIEGPVIIGKNVTIKSHAYIRPYTIIGDNCVIGHSAEIKHSLIMDNAKVQSMTFVGDSIIGDSARVGSGTIVANRRFDQKDIGIKYKDNFYNYNTDFFGCVLGDYARLGANVSTLPGSLIGPHSWVMPLTRIQGFTQKEKLVSSNQETLSKNINPTDLNS